MPNALAVRNPTQLAVRGKIDQLQHTMEKEITAGRMEKTIDNCSENNDQADHFFGHNVYARGLLIPAGTVVIGKLHREDRICIIAQGECTFVDEFKKRKVKAPYVGEFKAGSKTAVYAHTDTYWIACHGTEITDPNEMVEKMVSADHDDYQLYLEHNEEEI